MRQKENQRHVTLIVIFNPKVKVFELVWRNHAWLAGNSKRGAKNSQIATRIARVVLAHAVLAHAVLAHAVLAFLLLPGFNSLFSLFIACRFKDDSYAI